MRRLKNFFITPCKCRRAADSKRWLLRVIGPCLVVDSSRVSIVCTTNTFSQHDAFPSGTFREECKEDKSWNFYAREWMSINGVRNIWLALIILFLFCRYCRYLCTSYYYVSILIKYFYVSLIYLVAFLQKFDNVEMVHRI